MKDQSAKHILSDELIAAYLDGNATAAECLQVLQAMEHDAQLRERLRISLTVDAEMGLLLQQSHQLPTMAMAANCEEGSFCCLQCEKFILRRRAISYDEQQLLDNAVAPFKVTDTEGEFDVIARCNGGGISGQAGAIRHGLARALVAADETTRAALKKAGCMTRDSRMKERKKPGQPGARKRFQFSKR